MYYCVKCINEPRGRGGLKGYLFKEYYLAEKMAGGPTAAPYWRVWPTEDWSYYETCGTTRFRLHFKIYEKIGEKNEFRKTTVFGSKGVETKYS